jgi:hypothetical protein
VLSTLVKYISQSIGGQGEVAPFLRVIRPMPKLDPAALHVDCGLRGQDLRLVEGHAKRVRLMCSGNNGHLD